MTEDTQHPALSNAPKTLRESLQRIVDYYDTNGEMARRCYQNRHGCRCAIGVFFTDEQLADIEQRSLNMANMNILKSYVGHRNIRAMTGMTMEQTLAVQMSNDYHPENMIREIMNILERGKGHVRGVLFELDKEYDNHEKNLPYADAKSKSGLDL